MIERGAILWADLGEPRGSRPTKRRPVVVVSSDDHNRSRLRTVIVVAITSNTSLAELPGNVFLAATASGLPKDSVVNVTAIATLDKQDLLEPAGQVPSAQMNEIDRGLRLSLAL